MVINMKKILMMFMLVGLVLTVCNIANAETESIIEESDIKEINNNYKTSKNTRFVCVTFIDEEFLLKIAQYKGGTIEDKAYTIMVTMNRVWDDKFYEKYSEYTLTTVQDVVLRELYEIDNLTAFEFEEIIPDEDCFKAMQMVKQGFDNSNGSLEYK